jgi:Kef-type K+ transport system membrane component KefB
VPHERSEFDVTDVTYYTAALWLVLALGASLVSIKLGISVALVEIAVGVAAGNTFGLKTTPWIDVIAAIGSVMLTFLAGAEIDPESLRRNLGKSLGIGFASFLLPFLAALAFALFVLGWPLRQAEIAGLALSTTSVAVVYAVMIESGLSQVGLGKVILAACFVTDLGTVLALGLLFATFSPWLLVFAAALVVTLVLLPRAMAWLSARISGRVSEPEVKLVFAVLLALGGLATTAGSEAVLPAYLVGLACAGAFARDRVLVTRIRSIAFAFLTPFYFLKAGLFVSIAAVVAGAGIILALLAVKVAAKSVGVWPVARLFGIAPREATYTTLLMSTGLTFGTISSLYGLTHGIIDQAQYTILVSVVIGSAVVPTLIATTFFHPHHLTRPEADEFEAAGEIDAVPIEP